MINQKKLESGRSMIEMLGVLAIIGVLSVGGIAGYSKAMLKYKTNKAIDEITQLASNIRIAFTNARDYTDLGTGIGNGGMIIDAYNILPGEMYKNKGANGANEYQTPWGTPVHFSVSQRTIKDTGHNRAFQITFENIPASACAELALADWGGNASGSGLIAMSTADGSSPIDLAGYYEDACTGDTDKVHCIVNPGQAIDEAGHEGFPVGPSSAVLGCGQSGFSSMAWKFY